MTTTRSRHLADNPFALSSPGGIRGAWERFWFTPTDAIGLHVLRVLTGLLFLAWLLPLAGQVESFYGLDGWFDHKAFEDAARLQNELRQQPGQEQAEVLKPMNWSLTYLPGLDPQGLKAVYWISMAVLVLFTFGIATRLTAVLTWVIAVSFTANPAMEYDADAFLIFFSFYLMLGYVFLGQRRRDLSWTNRLLGGRSAGERGCVSAPSRPQPSIAANLALRLVQVHFAIVMLTTGVHKLQFGDWWSGLAFWYPNHPAFQTTLDMAREHVGDRNLYLSVLSIGAYAVLFWQIGFLLFAWRRGWAWRLVLVGGGLIGWLGCAFIYRLPLMGPAFFIGSLSYLTAEEWRAIFAGLARLTGLKRLAPVPSLVGEPAALATGEGAAVIEKKDEASLLTVGDH